MRDFKWHALRPLFAIAHNNDAVYFFDVAKEGQLGSLIRRAILTLGLAWLFEVLHSEFQRNVQCIQWRPNGGSTLAVSSEYVLTVASGVFD